MTDKNDAGEHTQNANDGDDHTQNIDSKLQEMEQRLSKQMTGAITRQLTARGKSTSAKSDIDLSSVVEVDGERLTVSEIIEANQLAKAEKVETARERKRLDLERRLQDRGFAAPAVLAKALIDDERLAKDPKFLDKFATDNPALILDRTRAGASSGATGGTVDDSGGKLDLTNEQQRESHFDNLAQGKDR